MFFKAKPELPQDFALVVHYFQQKSELNEEQLSLKIRYLDTLLSQLSEEERLSLLKAELYKAHLRLSRGQNLRRESFEEASLQLVLKTLNEKKLDPYMRFFLQALSVDLRNLMQDSNYPTFLAQWRIGPQNLSPQLQGFKRRFDLLLPWVEWLKFSEIDGLEEKLKIASELAVESAILRIENFLLMTQLQKQKLLPNMNQLQFFTVVKLEGEKTSQDGTALKIIENVIQNAKDGPDENKPWVPRAEPDPNYIAPTSLPAPVYDWDPKPLDDWLNDL